MVAKSLRNKWLCAVTWGVLLALEASCAQLTQSTVVVTVNRYEVWEETFSIDSSGYSNPWEDVDVSVTFSAPSGRRVTVGGFY
ncbi:MAG: DUF5060 domain-containing protein, partial [bacterium JZ-2024 1]